MRIFFVDYFFLLLLSLSASPPTSGASVAVHICPFYSSAECTESFVFPCDPLIEGNLHTTYKAWCQVRQLSKSRQEKTMHTLPVSFQFTASAPLMRIYLLLYATAPVTRKLIINKPSLSGLPLFILIDILSQWFALLSPLCHWRTHWTVSRKMHSSFTRYCISLSLLSVWKHVQPAIHTVHWSRDVFALDSVQLFELSRCIFAFVFAALIESRWHLCPSVSRTRACFFLITILLHYKHEEQI